MPPRRANAIRRFLTRHRFDALFGVSVLVTVALGLWWSVFIMASINAKRDHDLRSLAYEAQIAGLTDDNPFARALDWPKRLLKQLSRRDVEARRAAVGDALARAGLDCALYNGGGTGSLAWCSGESALTEVTAGSGFLCSHLFDYYHQGLALEPAALFALQVVRRPAPNVVTCHGGGYVASGEVGRDRLPVPYLPRGLTLFDLEGAGEVQTPMRLPDGVFLALGDPVFMRHAKAGELAEHFGAYLLYQGGRIVGRAPTYRGLGQTFL